MRTPCPLPSGRALLVVSLTLLIAVAPRLAGAHVGRVEIYPLETKTFADKQLLRGERDGVSTTVAAELRLPPGTRGRVPVVVLLHGSGGLGAWTSEWADWFSAQGVATLTVDSFSGRGIVHTVADQGQLGRLTPVIDAYQALGVLAKHQRIDQDRIIVMGFSRGAQAALYASLRRLQQYKASPLSFAAYIAFYPPCNTAYRDDVAVANAPIRIFHGAADDWTPADACRAYIARLRAAGVDAEMFVYPKALHGFDSRTTNPPVRVPSGQTTRNCRLMEATDGTIVNAETQQEFRYTDACVERGATIGYSEEATLQAQAAIRDLLMSLEKFGSKKP